VQKKKKHMIIVYINKKILDYLKDTLTHLPWVARRWNDNQQDKEESLYVTPRWDDNTQILFTTKACKPSHIWETVCKL